MHLLSVLPFSALAFSQVITSDSYFYGQSPYAAPPATSNGTGDWGDAYSKAKAFVEQLSIEEKANLTMGIGQYASTNFCAGNIQAIPRLGFPGLCAQDAGNGVRGTDFVSGFASGIHVAASWNKNLAYQRAHAMGGEFYKKGVSLALGPVVGPMGRTSLSGRIWEGFGPDSYLSGSLAHESVMGLQERGVMASVKHYIVNEQEDYRSATTTANGTVVAAISADLDDRTLHELYLWPFAEAVRAGAANIMCSYNRVNASYSCQNSYLLNHILKEELGFQGFVISDWGAQHAGYASAEAGLDMVMIDGGVFWGEGKLVEAVQNGSLSESRLDDMATRIMASWYKLGQDSPDTPAPGVGMDNVTIPHEIVDARDPATRPTILQGAVEGHVLVKNTGVLPLKSPRLLTLLGYDAPASNFWDLGLGTALYPWGLGFTTVSPDVIASEFGESDQTVFSQRAPNGTLTVGGGSGTNDPTYISSPFEALSVRAQEDGTALYWDFKIDEVAPFVPPNSDACLVFINAFAREGIDRNGAHDPFSDDLVNNVADQCSNTVVVVHNAGVQLVDAFVDHPNVSAVVLAHLPGQDSGKALVSLLYGDENFSGKLPYTVPYNESDYGPLFEPTQPSGDFALYPQVNYTEGVFIDYRRFDALNITPRYEFGYGLSYTTFEYSNITVSSVEGPSLASYPVGAILPGGQEDLWDVIFQVRADVENTGDYDGQEIAQLYIGIPGDDTPIRQLRGFSKVGITKGEKVTVEFDLLRRDLSVWDVVAQNWLLQSGTYNVWVGSSSRTLPLKSTITI